MSTNYFGRLMLGGRAAVTAFRQAMTDPSVRDTSTVDEHRARAAFLWAWYTNSVFDALMDAAAYRQYHNLYRNTRTIINPVTRCVDWYAGRVYPGVVTVRPSDLPNGVQSAVPLAPSMDPAVVQAVGEWWDMTNWQTGKNTMVRFGAIAGDVLVGLADDPFTGVVTADIVWGGEIAALDLDPAGNVERYRREFQVLDASGKAYLYGKEVDRDTIRTYKDGRLHAYDDNPAEWDNPYGFVPAVWAKHKDIGATYGAPATACVLPKLDEINQYISLVVDRSRKVFESPLIITAPASLKNILGRAKTTDDTTQAVAAEKEDDRDVIRTLRLPPGTEIHQLELTVDSALAVIEALNREIEADLPELTMYRELRAMTQVTGPAAARLVGDVESRLVEAAANYDRPCERLFTMALAVSGWRASSGAWGPVSSLTERQRAFLPFSLDTYTGKSDIVAIQPRPLIPETREEQVAAVLAESRLDGNAMRRLGFSEEEIAQADAERERAAEAQATRFESLMRGG